MVNTLLAMLNRGEGFLEDSFATSRLERDLKLGSISGTLLSQLINKIKTRQCKIIFIKF